MNSSARTIYASLDPDLVACVVATDELVYTTSPEGEDAAAHVRAASAICGFGGHLAILQDDANWLALVDPSAGSVVGVSLPKGPEGKRLFSDRRGNKHHKMDLEACTIIVEEGGHTLLGFGSGSLGAREKIVCAFLPSDEGSAEQIEIDVYDAKALYARLRASAEFAGSELNVEGAVLLDDQTLRLFQRGNGATTDGLLAVDASCDLSLDALRAYLEGTRLDDAQVEPPEPREVLQYEIGELDGVRLTFTDATRLGERVLFLAAAEDSPDVVRDGPITGAVVGVIGPDGSARWTPLVAPSGRALQVKAEGIWVDEDTSGTAYIVCDPDDIDQPARLLTVELSGRW